MVATGCSGRELSLSSALPSMPAAEGRYGARGELRWRSCRRRERGRPSRCSCASTWVDAGRLLSLAIAARSTRVRKSPAWPPRTRSGRRPLPRLGKKNRGRGTPYRCAHKISTRGQDTRDKRTTTTDTVHTTAKTHTKTTTAKMHIPNAPTPQNAESGRLLAVGASLRTAAQRPVRRK